MDTKHWWQSMTLWGAAIVVAGVALRLLGHEAEAATIEAESEGIIIWLGQLMEIIGAAVAFWGRLRAKTILTK